MLLTVLPVLRMLSVTIPSAATSASARKALKEMALTAQVQTAQLPAPHDYVTALHDYVSACPQYIHMIMSVHALSIST